MSNDVVPTQSFQEKISDKIKESIGTLITDEDLKPLIEQSVKKLLTEDRIRAKSSGYGTETFPPLLEELIVPHLDKQLRELCDQYFSQHPEVLSEAIQKVLGDGLLKAVHRVIDNKMTQPLYELQQKIEDMFIKHNMF